LWEGGWGHSGWAHAVPTSRFAPIEDCGGKKSFLVVVVGGGLLFFADHSFFFDHSKIQSGFKKSFVPNFKKLWWGGRDFGGSLRREPNTRQISVDTKIQYQPEKMMDKF